MKPRTSIDGEQHLNEVFFDGVRVPVGNLVGEEGRGWDCAKYLLSSERTNIANVGGLWERLDRALELTAWRFLLDPDIARTQPGFASVLKLKGSELMQELSALLARLAGPAGLERRSSNEGGAEHPLSAAVPRYLFFRAATIDGGSSEVQKDILAKTLLG